ncbi:MAG: hypothetical protein RLZZ216_1271, partial [Cyanobacteriota bacterium]
MSTNNPKRSAPNAKASAQQLSSEVAQFSVSDLAHFSMSLDMGCLTPPLHLLRIQTPLSAVGTELGGVEPSGLEH